MENCYTVNIAGLIRLLLSRGGSYTISSQILNVRSAVRVSSSPEVLRESAQVNDRQQPGARRRPGRSGRAAAETAANCKHRHQRRSVASRDSRGKVGDGGRWLLLAGFKKRFV